MTLAEKAIEHEVIRLTRLGNLCGTGTPTEEQETMAMEEADEHIAALERQEND